MDQVTAVFNVENSQVVQSRVAGKLLLECIVDGIFVCEGDIKVLKSIHVLFSELAIIKAYLNISQPTQLYLKDVIGVCAILIEQLVGAHSTILRVDLDLAPVRVVDKRHLSDLIVDVESL